MYRTYANIGLARNASQSAYPNLWRNLVGLWVPSAPGFIASYFPDLSGHRNDLVAFVDLPLVPGRTGLAWSVGGGTVNRGQSRHGNDLSGASKFTLMSWARQDTIDVKGGLFCKLGTAAATDTMQIETYNDGMIYAEVNNGANTYGFFDYSTAVTAGKWFHWAWVFDGSGATNAAKMQLYIDGKPIALSFFGTLPAAAPTNTGVYQLAIFHESASWTGLIDDFRMYTRALSAREVRLSMFASPLTLRRRLLVGKAGAVVPGQPTMRRWGGVPTMLGGPLAGRTW